MRALAAGFDDPVFDGQAVFTSVMWAMAEPGRVRALPTTLSPPPPLTPELAAFALALADHETPLWLDAPLAAAPVADFLRFHTGARIAEERADAAFALVAAPAGLGTLDGFALGAEDYPDRSTTLVLALEEAREGGGPWLRGPGIPERRRLHMAPLPPDFWAAVARNRTLSPRGLDIALVAPGCVVGLPRSTRLADEA